MSASTAVAGAGREAAVGRGGASAFESVQWTTAWWQWLTPFAAATVAYAAASALLLGTRHLLWWIGGLWLGRLLAGGAAEADIEPTGCLHPAPARAYVALRMGPTRRAWQLLVMRRAVPAFVPSRIRPVAVLLRTAVVLMGLPADVACQTGLEIAGVPALSFDADEGFGYGAVVELYGHGDGSVLPYRWTLQPTVFLTTEGRRDFTVFFDAPALVGAWRVDAFIGSEEQIATPWYGIGNETPFDAGRVDDADPWFYRYGRTRRSLSLNGQRALGSPPIRLLLGVGAAHGSIVPVPRGEGTTLLADELAAASRDEPDGWANHVRAGLIWDTRDRESGPTRGVWSELLVQRVDELLGSRTGYTRWTLTDRRYVALGPLVFAHRVLLQQTSAGVPLHDLHRVQTSYKQQEGLGGARTVRGVLRNRYIGRGLLVWNLETRYRAADFSIAGRPFHLVLSAFVDAGRVWEDEVRLDELVQDLHRGWGGGVRVGMGENFVVAFDGGTSTETGLQLYIGLGYLY